MKTIIFASTNLGKYREFSELLKSTGIHLLDQKSQNIPSVAETGLSFVENAIIKARNAAAHSQMPTIADDSGLVVDALHGEPGVHSARYAGSPANDNNNIAKLLKTMNDISASDRTAHFHCALAYFAYPRDPNPRIFQGSWHGQILTTAQGADGFGYDPIFYLPEYDCSAAELPLEKKNQISHRGKAIKELLHFLQQNHFPSPT